MVPGTKERFSIPDDFRDKLVNTTIVEIDGSYYLALTGCGMDMTWEIVESYINLGYYPPAHFCRLPCMAGKNLNKGTKDSEIIEICNESLKTAIGWHSEMINHNMSLFANSMESCCPQEAPKALS